MTMADVRWKLEKWQSSAEKHATDCESSFLTAMRPAIDRSELNYVIVSTQHRTGKFFFIIWVSRSDYSLVVCVCAGCLPERAQRMEK